MHLHLGPGPWHISVLKTRVASQGVLGCLVVSSSGQALRSSLDESLTKQYSELIPRLADLARNLVRDLDPQVSAHQGTRHHTHACELAPMRPCVDG